MSNNSQLSGDPFCTMHGLNPCSCRITYSTLQQSLTQTYCGGCNRPVTSCMCSSSSNPWEDRRKLQGVLPSGTSISVDTTKPQEPIKKSLADELKEIASKSAGEEIEAKSAHLFFLERAKIAAKRGRFIISYWLSKLPWTRQEIDVAAELLRADKFNVCVECAADLQVPDIEITISWE